MAGGWGHRVESRLPSSVFLSSQDWAVVVPVLNLPPAQVVHVVPSLVLFSWLPAAKHSECGHVVFFAEQEEAVLVPVLNLPPRQDVQVASVLFPVVK